MHLIIYSFIYCRTFLLFRVLGVPSILGEILHECTLVFILVGLLQPVVQHTHQWALDSGYYIIMNTHNVYSDSVTQALSCCYGFNPEHQMWINLPLKWVPKKSCYQLFESFLLKRVQLFTKHSKSIVLLYVIAETPPPPLNYLEKDRILNTCLWRSGFWWILLALFLSYCIISSYFLLLPVFETDLH